MKTIVIKDEEPFWVEFVSPDGSLYVQIDTYEAFRAYAGLCWSGLSVLERGAEFTAWLHEQGCPPVSEALAYSVLDRVFQDYPPDYYAKRARASEPIGSFTRRGYGYAY